MPDLVILMRKPSKLHRQCAGIGVPNLIGDFRRMFGKKDELRTLDVLIVDEVWP